MEKKIVELEHYRKKKDIKKTIHLFNKIDFEKLFLRKGKEIVIRILERVLTTLKEG